MNLHTTHSKHGPRHVSLTYTNTHTNTKRSTDTQSTTHNLIYPHIYNLSKHTVPAFPLLTLALHLADPLLPPRTTMPEPSPMSIGYCKSKV